MPDPAGKRCLTPFSLARDVPRFRRVIRPLALVSLLYALTAGLVVLFCGTSFGFLSRTGLTAAAVALGVSVLVMAVFLVLEVMRRPALALVVTILLGAGVPVVSEILITDIDLWVIAPVAACLVALGGAWAALRRERRAAATAWAAGAVAVTYLFLMFHVAPVLYDHLSTRGLAALIDPKERTAAGYYCWGGSGLSFKYYTGADVQSFRYVESEGPGQLAELFASGRRVYFLVRGKDNLTRLEAAVPEGLVILGKTRNRWLVTNRTAAGPER